jgi:hypothetical protein
VLALAAPMTATAQKMKTDIPKSITTPDVVETRLGTLRFRDGLPDDATIQKAYDNLDFQRGVQAFLTAMPGASLVAMRAAYRQLGAVDGTVAISETLLDSKALWLTPNTDTVYAMSWIDLKNGPVVIESPPDALGIVDDFWFRYVTDLGLAGPDKGKGGKFLFLPPGYKGEVPEGYFVFRSPTYGNWYLSRGFLIDGSPKGRVDIIKKHTRIYPLSQAANPPPQKFINVSGVPHNSIHANDFTFYEEVNQIVQEEPNEAQDPEILGVLAAIGIEKGKPFAPDARMKKILTESAAVGNATVRSILMKPRDKANFYYPDGSWRNPLLIGGYEFLQQPGVRSLDSRSNSLYYFTGITPAMSRKMVGVGSQYAYTWMPTVTRSTAPRPTSCTCRRKSRRRTSGRSSRTTTRRDRNSRPTSNTQASVASGKARSSTPTARWMCTSARPRLKAMKRTGSRPSPARAGTPCCASTVRSNPGSTRPGVWVRSNW